jgi:hypothetical protein
MMRSLAHKALKIETKMRERERERKRIRQVNENMMAIQEDQDGDIWSTI